MGPKSTKSELLQGKDSYNRMSLQINWARAQRNSSSLKFDLLRHDYGDSRIDYLGEKRNLLSEGLKI